MISMVSRDGRKGLGLGQDEEAELEEGEAYCNPNENKNEDSTIDPDIALSYIVGFSISHYYVFPFLCVRALYF